MTSKLDTLSLIQFAKPSPAQKNNHFMDIGKTKGRDFKSDFIEARNRNKDYDRRDIDSKHPAKDIDKNFQKKILNTNKVQYKHNKVDESETESEEKLEETEKAKVQMELEALLELLNGMTPIQQTEGEIAAVAETSESVLAPELLNQIKMLLGAIISGEGTAVENFGSGTPKFSGEIHELLNTMKLQNVEGALKELMPQGGDIKSILEQLIKGKMTGSQEGAGITEGLQIDQQTIIKDTLVKPLKDVESKYDKKNAEAEATQAEEGTTVTSQTKANPYMPGAAQEKAKIVMPGEKVLNNEFKLNIEQKDDSMYAKNSDMQSNKTSEPFSVKTDAKLQRTAEVPRFEVINQIVKKAHVFIREGHSEMNMHLEPAKLGKLSLKLIVEQGLVTAKFTAESQQVKEIIESNFNQLKDMLQEKGINVQNFSVSVGQDGQNQSEKQSFATWKEYSENNSRRDSINSGSFTEAAENYDRPTTVNPYEYHDGKIDYKA